MANIEQSERGFKDFLAALRRRMSLFMTVSIGLGVLVLLIAILLPSIYRSSAIVLIEQQEIPTELVRSTVTSYADQRIQTISQRVMTTSNLTEIMDKYNLYPEERAEAPTSAVLAEMRDDIELEMISADVMDPKSGRPTEATIAFELSYESKSPALAQRVTNELTNLYLSENIKNRTQMATETTSFLQDEAEELASQVSTMEAELAAFKEKHADSLPEMNDLNLQIRERLTRELRDIDGRLRSLDERIIYLESELAQLDHEEALYNESGRRIIGPADRLKLLETELVTARGRYSDDHPTIQRLKRELDALRQQLGRQDSRTNLLAEREKLNSRLLSLKQRYGADHPDVLATQKRIDATTTALNELGPLALGESNSPSGHPAFLQITSQLQAAESERRSLMETRKDLQSRIEKVESALKGTPQVEREYRNLVRGYENAVAKFQEVKAKQLEAQLAQSLEQERKGERFTLIEPPLLPEEPVKPNRLALLLVGLLLTLFAGFGGVMIADALDESVTGPKDISRYLDEPPLAVIPYISNDEDLQRRHVRYVVTSGAALGLLVLGGMFLHFAVIPLDVLWLSLVRRF